LEIDRFLLDVMPRLQGTPDVSGARTLPKWLGEALDKLRETRQFSDGVKALASLSARTPEHVNATLKMSLGLTATEVLNQARMDYAASQLRISTKKILEICFDSGFENLGHFYKVFKARFGMTPRSYRLKHLTSVGG
jgi:AraC family cel operon transcriptional repressor